MIKILVVDDSAFSRKVIARILETIPGVQVVDTAVDGQDALKKTMRHRPDLITLDLEMPHMDGFTFLRWLMASIPTPVIVVSAQEADDNVFKAMDLGAVDFVVKPTRYASMQLEEIKVDLIEKVLATPLLAMRKIKDRMEEQKTQNLKLPVAPTSPAERPKVVGIASSTGGPPAIQAILGQLPSDFDVPIVIAQHMPPSFTALFAERLNKYTTLRVKEAANEEPMQPGHVYIAPGGMHLVVERRTGKTVLCTREKEMDPRYHPSANVLFRSIAEELESRCVGVVLTGMGDDGKEGLKEMKDKGAITIAESDKTAIIFGMPQESIKAGVVDYILPLHEIPGHLAYLCKPL
jgi:two-component system chemotaxis response regulator CheB